MSRVKRPKNPFDDDDDQPNGFVFVPKGPSGPTENKYGYGDFGVEEGEGEPFDEPSGAYSLQSQIEERQQNMVQSTQRSLGLLYESEDIGNETAHELLRQGEQLKNVETKVDKINKDLDASKRHVTALRSVFGGVINYFQGKKAEPEKVEEQPQATSKLRTLVGGRSGSETQRQDDELDHPAMRLRDPHARNYNSRYDTSGFEETPSSSTRGNSSRMKQFDQQIDNNLDEMSNGLSRLKNLGLGLGDEIERQNDDLDRITTKTGNVDTRLEGVNRDVNKILYR